MENNIDKFNSLRKQYPNFIYEKYEMFEDASGVTLKFYFNVPGLTSYSPEIRILKKNMNFKKFEGKFIENLVFHIGLVELISYWKCTCSPNVHVACGYLDDEQLNYFKKLYFNGLGELFYLNGIKTTIEDFMHIECTGQKEVVPLDNSDDYDGMVIPIGGGKDSIVTLELLKDPTNNLCLILNPKDVTKDCAYAAGYSDDQIIEIYRTLDPEMLRLNKEGFISGHTPFSILLAFISYFVTYMTNHRFIALSNESSANESNVIGETANHQYAKSFAAENDFDVYAQKYFNPQIRYFSFLSPLNELQIGMLFSRYEGYHKIFRSCNVGSKVKPWEWCCNCAKCLFVYIMLSPFLYKEKLVKIYGQDMFTNRDLLKIFIQIIGEGEHKPFECVGTYEEAKYAITQTIANLNQSNQPLPYLLAYYQEHYSLADLSDDITKAWNEEHNVPSDMLEILRGEIFNGNIKLPEE